MWKCLKFMYDVVTYRGENFGPKILEEICPPDRKVSVTLVRGILYLFLSGLPGFPMSAERMQETCSTVKL